MKSDNSSKSLRSRHRANQIVRRKGRVYIINKVQKRYKAARAEVRHAVLIQTLRRAGASARGPFGLPPRVAHRAAGCPLGVRVSPQRP